MSARAHPGILLLTLLLATAATGQGRRPHPVPAKDAAALQDFEARVTRYLDLRKETAGSPPAPTSSATKLKNSQEGIRARIQANRTNARQGDIFTPQIAAYFHRQIASAFKGQRGAKVLVSLEHAEPRAKFPLRVNEAYPDGIPLQSMPPTLLLKLPKLPKELQYRIVGRNLVLLDIEPNLAVDILPNAIPGS